MKHSAFILFSASTLLSASPHDYVNFLRQTQFDSFVQWDAAIDSAGTMLSPREAGDLGSLYQLWAIDGRSGREVSIDREFVSDYTPEIKVEVETGDPHQLIPRTRVDRPFTVRVSVSEWPVSASGKEVPLAARRLHFEHLAYEYGEEDRSLDEMEDPAARVVQEFVIEDDGNLVLQFPAASLTGNDLTRAKGLEVFTVSSYVENNGHGNNADDADLSNPAESGPDPSGSIDDETAAGGRFLVGAIIEQARVQVWPIAAAAITGIDPARVYNELPPVTVDLVDLYPDSTTYVRVYEGAPRSSPAQPVEIGPACVVVRDSLPQDRTLVIKDLDDYLSKAGTYTVEVLHQTPFGTDILAQFYPLRIEWKVGIRGTIFSND